MRSSGPEEDPYHGEHRSGAARASADLGEERPARGARGDGGSGDGGGGRKRKGSFWRELPILIVTALVLTVLIQFFLARVYVIPSESMEKTLHGCSGCNDDRVLVDKVTYDFSSPKPGDVVVFKGPPSWDTHEFQSQEPTNPVGEFFQGAASLLGFGAPDEKDFVKRVIATGGQTVSCCDSQNRVMVDGKPLSEPYIYWQPGHGTTQEPFAPVTVPPGHVWMMGDNRNNSSDSRYQGGGGPKAAVPEQDVIGKARFIVLPPSRWQVVPDRNPQQQSQALGAPGWQTAVPAGVGFAAAFPVVRTGRTLVARRRRGRERS
jgi:signal peptidase I